MRTKKTSTGKHFLLSCTVNGRKISRLIRSSLLLIEFIRDELGLRGTKPGCLEGECGTCSVLVNGAAVNSCLFLAVNASGKNVTTIEGLGEGKTFHPVQEAMIRHGAVQCGFCSPGMAIAIRSMDNHFKKKKKKPSREEIAKGLEGNLCRCTGYVKIIDAAEEVISGKKS